MQREKSLLKLETWGEITTIERNYSGPLTLVKTILSIASIAVLSSQGVPAKAVQEQGKHLGRPNQLSSFNDALQVDDLENLKEQKDEIGLAADRLKEGIANGEALTLLDASKTLTLNNPTLKAARSEVEYYQWTLTSKKLGWLPTVSFYNTEDATLEISSTNYEQITYEQLNTENKITSGSRSTLAKGLFTASNYKNSEQTVLFSPGLSIQWTFLDIPRQYEISESSSMLSAYQFLYIDTLQSQLLSLQREYYSAQRSLYLIKAYTDLYEETAKVYEVILNRYQDGLVNKAELAQTKTQLYSVGVSLLTQYEAFYSASSLISQLTGSVTDVLLYPSATMKKVGKWDMLLHKTLKNAKLNNEKAKSALQKAQAYESQSRYYKSTYLPKISILGILGYTGTDETNSFKNYEYKRENVYGRSYDNILGINLTWSIFDGGVNYANSRAAQKYRDYYVNTATANYQNAQAKAKSNYYKMLMSNSSINLSSSEIKSAKTALEVSTVRYNVGISNITTLVQNLQQVLSAQSEYADSVYDYNSAVAGLYRWSSEFSENETFKRLKN